MGKAAASDDEKRVWDLLTKNFTWDVPPDHPVKVFRKDDTTGPVRLQLFEFATTCVLAEFQPQFVWHVTADGHDSGLDFIGTQSLFEHEASGSPPRSPSVGSARSGTMSRRS